LWAAGENATILQQPMHFLRYYLWIAPHLLLGFLLISFLRRGLQKRLPFFLAYVVFELVQFLILLVLNLPAFSRGHYSRVYVLGLVVSTFLKFGIVYELCTDLVVSHSSLATTLRPLMRWMAALFALVAALVVAAALPGARIQGVEDVFHFLQLSASVILAGLLIVLFVFTKVLRISWHSFATGVALGFGVFAAIEVATAAFRANFADPGNIVIDLLQMAAYHSCVVIWLVYVVLDRPATNFSGTGLQKSDLQFWDQELQRMVQR
jgi:hypothetical protein